MGRLIDIRGQRFHDAVVLERHGRDTTGKTTWLCVCDCGERFVAVGLNLKTGNTKSCGCRLNKPIYADRSGLRYGRLVVTGLAKHEAGKTWWACLCGCGNETVVSTAHLISGHTKSCGCLKVGASREVARKHLSRQGDEHPRWNPSLTDAERRGQRSGAAQAWAKRVREADLNMCVICGSTHKPSAHHLYSHAEIVERRDDPSNGVCLCQSCHVEFHKKYGYRGFSRSDFFEFSGFDDPGDFSPIGPLPSGDLGLAVRSLRAGNAIEDLRKAAFYINREIQRRGGEE